MTDPPAAGRIVGITLDEHTVIRRTPDIEQERASAIFDLLEENAFQPRDLEPGAYPSPPRDRGWTAGLQHRDAGAGTARPRGAGAHVISPDREGLFPGLRKLFDAIRKLSPSQIETIDMGRRGLHDEGAALLQDRLAGKITLDKNTARRLFTLVCVLHIR